MPEKSRVTLHDVADLAGVSHQTVSRVINKSERVRPETRERVEAAIIELGYRPNVIARSMARGSTRTLGCISPNLTDPVFAEIIEGAQSEARRQGYFILIGSASTVEEVKPLLDELLARRVDGLIVLNARDDERYQLLLPLVQDTPIVYIKNSPNGEKVSSVHCDDTLGGYLATKHLIDLGHQNIAVILGRSNEQCTKERLQGYQQALEEAGIPFQEHLILQGTWSSHSGSEAVEKLLAQPGQFTAIFAMNDRMAAGAVRSLQVAGFEVPENYAVVGYDNVPLSRLTNPPLSTVHQPLEDFGKRAVQILINTLQENTQPVDLCITPEFIPRASSLNNVNSS